MYAEDRASLETLGLGALRLPSTASVGFINRSNQLIAVTGNANIMTADYIKPCIEHSSFNTLDYLHICKPIIANTKQLSDFSSEEHNDDDYEQEQYGWVVLVISMEQLYLQKQSNLYLFGSIT